MHHNHYYMHLSHHLLLLFIILFFVFYLLFIYCLFYIKIPVIIAADDAEGTVGALVGIAGGAMRCLGVGGAAVSTISILYCCCLLFLFFKFF